MLTIALLSDTHVPDQIGRLPSGLLQRLAGADHILHAGDLVSQGVLDHLATIAATLAVRGNMDRAGPVRRLPCKRLLTLGGRRVGLIHGNQPHLIEQQYTGSGLGYDSPGIEALYRNLQQELPEAEIIVFGHLHVPVVVNWHGCLFVNPGAVAPNRGRSSFALLTLGHGAPAVEIVDL